MEDILHSIWKYILLVVLAVSGLTIIAIYLYFKNVERNVIKPIKKLEKIAGMVVGNIKREEDLNIDIHTGKGLAANAGHEHPALKRKNGDFEMIKYKHSLAVATIEGIPFKEHEFQLKAGDMLFVYTDGVTEATNSENELFGEERLVNSLNENKAAGPEELLPHIKADIDGFVGDAPQFDDITMLAFRYNAR